MALYPHLINAVEVVVLYVVEVNQLNYLKVIAFSRTCINPQSVTQLVIQSVVHIYHILTAKVSTVVVYYTVDDILAYVWVNALECIAEHFW